MNICRSLSLLFLFIVACTASVPELDGFDAVSWKQDRNACGGERERLRANLLDQKDKLLGLSEMEMVDVLGKPDQQEIYKRSEKFFYYYLSPSSECETPSPSPERLAIRFNAVGLAKEISID